MTSRNTLEFKLVAADKGALLTSQEAPDFELFIGNGENDGSFLNNAKPALESYLMGQGQKLTGIFDELVGFEVNRTERRILVQYEPA